MPLKEDGMKNLSTGLLSVVIVMGLGSVSSFAMAAFPEKQSRLEQVQYNRYPDQRRDDYNRYPDDRRNFDDRNFRGRPRWRPGQVVPAELLNQLVSDWEERGLIRPYGGAQWFRVGQQFLLVRERDRMIARILTFD
jgi:Ni/Co efflux regulator RcnB